MIILALVLLIASTPTPYTTYQVVVQADGSAVWIVEHRFPLSMPGEGEAFQDIVASLAGLKEDYRARIGSIVSETSRALGREMSIEEFNVSSRVVNTVGGPMGVVRVEFTWKGFSRVAEDGSLELGDAFIGGFYLSEGETLRVSAPPGYEIAEARPAPDSLGNGEVEWRGRLVFNDGEPHLLIKPSAPPTPHPQSPLTQGGELVYYAAGSAAASALAYLFLRQRRPRNPRRSEVDAVIDVLRSHGGRAYQSQIVRESGLSKSTVSVILKALEAEGRVMREKVGREKIVRLTK